MWPNQAHERFNGLYNNKKPGVIETNPPLADGLCLTPCCLTSGKEIFFGFYLVIIASSRIRRKSEGG
jgi:hypothetical protein